MTKKERKKERKAFEFGFFVLCHINLHVLSNAKAIVEEE